MHSLMLLTLSSASVNETPCWLSISCVTCVVSVVAWSSEMPGLMKALAESSTLKSLTLQTHQSR